MSKGIGDRVGDGAILQKTTQTQDGSMVTLSFTLPSGQEMQSEPIPANKLKAGVLMAWCQTVRDTITAESQEASAQARRDAAELAPEQEDRKPSPEALSGPVTDAPADPDEFIRGAVKAAEREMSAAAAALLAASQRNDSAIENLKKWEAVADGLGIAPERDDEPDSEVLDEAEGASDDE